MLAVLADGVLQRLDNKRIEAFTVLERPNREGTVHFRAGAKDEPPGITPVRRRRERPALLLVDLDPFVQNAADIPIHLRLVAAMAAGANPPGDGSDITAVVLGPGHELEIPVAGLPVPASSIFFRTSLSW
jgi:hypothetical protein